MYKLKICPPKMDLLEGITLNLILSEAGLEGIEMKFRKIPAGKKTKWGIYREAQKKQTERMRKLRKWEKSERGKR